MSKYARLDSNIWLCRQCKYLTYYFNNICLFFTWHQHAFSALLFMYCCENLLQLCEDFITFWNLTSSYLTTVYLQFGLLRLTTSVLYINVMFCPQGVRTTGTSVIPCYSRNHKHCLLDLSIITTTVPCSQNHLLVSLYKNTYYIEPLIIPHCTILQQIQSYCLVGQTAIVITFAMAYCTKCTQITNSCFWLDSQYLYICSDLQINIPVDWNTTTITFLD